METQTIERQRGNRTAGPASVVVYAGAAVFVIATAWFGRDRLPARIGSSLVGARAFPWISYTIVAELAVLATAGCYATGSDNLLDLAVLASGPCCCPPG